MNANINSSAVKNKFHESQRLLSVLRKLEIQPYKHGFTIQYPSGNSSAIRYMGINPNTNKIIGRNMGWDNLAAEKDYDDFGSYLVTSIFEIKETKQ